MRKSNSDEWYLTTSQIISILFRIIVLFRTLRQMKTPLRKPKNPNAPNSLKSEKYRKMLIAHESRMQNEKWTKYKVVSGIQANRLAIGRNPSPNHQLLLSHQATVSTNLSLIAHLYQVRHLKTRVDGLGVAAPEEAPTEAEGEEKGGGVVGEK